MTSERQPVEVINVWAVNDLKQDADSVRFLEGLPIESQSIAAQALKQAYILGFKKSLQHAASYVNSEATALDMIKEDSSKEYKYANNILQIGQQKL